MLARHHDDVVSPVGGGRRSDDSGRQQCLKIAGPQRASPTANTSSVLGYEDTFNRSMSLWANFALGFTYLSPLVGVYSLFAVGPLDRRTALDLVDRDRRRRAAARLARVRRGRLAVPDPRRHLPLGPAALGPAYAWMAAWVYIWAMIVTITSVAEFGIGFAASLFGIEHTNDSTLWLTARLLVIALAINFTGTKWLARVARIGLAAELIGVIGLGLYLLIFQRKQEFSVFFDTMGVEGDGSYAAAFMGAALAGLFLFYGFEACGDVAEEVENPARRIPKAMMLTILVGGVSALFSFGGYVLAAPDLASIVNGEDADPIPGILEATLGPVGAKIFLVIAITAFLSCVLSLQAAASRLLFSFARDGMIPGHRWLSRVSPTHEGADERAHRGVHRARAHRRAHLGEQRPAGRSPLRGARHLRRLPDGRARLAPTAHEGLAAGRPVLPRLMGLHRERPRPRLRHLRHGAALAAGFHGDFFTDYVVLIGLGVVVVTGLVYLLSHAPIASRMPRRATR